MYFSQKKEKANKHSIDFTFGYVPRQKQSSNSLKRYQKRP